MPADSLSEHLLNQLHGAGGTGGDARAGDRRDARRDRLSERSGRDIAEATGEPIGVVEEALALVQDLDPAGVGARNLAECLALQAKAADRYDPAMARLIDNLDLLSQRAGWADLKRICGVDDEDLADMVRELRAYDPKPGCQFSAKGVESVTPDVFIRRDPRRLCGRAQLCDFAAAAGQPALLSGAEDRTAGRKLEGLAERMPDERQLAGQGARPAGADDRQGRVARS